MSGAQAGSPIALGGRPGVRLWSTATIGGGHSTVVTMGGGWAWPNENETQILVFADPSWMQVGQTLAIDDGVHTPGELLIVTIVPGDIENPTLVECAWTPVGPGGGTSMLDGAAVTLVV